MRYFLAILFLLSFCLLKAQQPIEGKVIDAESKKPLAFVNIQINNSSRGISTDINGKFKFLGSTKIDSLKFSYLGYDKKTLSKKELQQINYTVSLKANAYELEEVEILPGINPAHRIIEAAIENKDINNPEKATEFSYESYNKLVFTGKSDSTISQDSISNLDSTDKETIDILKKRHLFLMESVTERNHIPPTHSKEIVVASRVSGLKNPLFSLIGTQLQSFTLYDTYVKLLGGNYLSPVTEGSINKYLFVLEDTLFQGSDTVYSISFRPRKGKFFDGLKGVITINTNGFAVQNFIAETINSSSFHVKIQQKFEYINKEQWFPTQLNTIIIMADEDFGKIKPTGVGTSFIRNITLSSDLSKKEIGNTILKMADDAGKKEESYWENYREDSLTEKEKNTYQFVDSIGEEANFDKKIFVYQALLKGLLPVGPFDLILNRFLDYNGYEGFRLGIGAETNDKLLKHFRVGGYFTYGFKDEKSKYGTHITWTPESNRQFTTQISYANDVIESGGSSFFKDRTNPFSSENFQKLFILQMDNIEKYQFSVSFQALRDFNFTFFGNTQARKINFDNYVFNDPALAFNDHQEQLFKLAEVGVETRWSFREKFVEMFGIKTPISYNYPIVHLKYTRGIAGLLEGDFDYNRIDLKVEKTVLLKNLGQSFFRLNAGFIDQSIPITAQYRATGTFNENLPLVADFSFQTAAPNEFFQDQYVSFFYKHSFKNLLYNSESFNPVLVVSTALGFGQMNSPSDHQNIEFTSMEKGFYESGVQIDRLIEFINLGIGAFYRYGPYSNEEIEDNFAFKITSTFKL
ncbi:MAG: DUF5686 family protein [Vicingaceae bacterium]